MQPPPPQKRGGITDFDDITTGLLMVTAIKSNTFGKIWAIQSVTVFKQVMQMYSLPTVFKQNLKKHYVLCGCKNNVSNMTGM